MRKLTLKPERISGKPIFSDEQILKLVESKIAIYRIAKLAERDPHYIYNLMKDNNIPSRRERQSKARKELRKLMLKDQKNKMTIKEIAKKYKKTCGATASIIYNTY